MLLTYHKWGIRAAQLVFIGSLAWHGIEAISPSLQMLAPPSSGFTLSNSFVLGYRVGNGLVAFLFLWLLKLFDEKPFRANYAIVSRAHTQLFNHLYGKRPQTKPETSN
jgi:hypothetical protein